LRKDDTLLYAAAMTDTPTIRVFVDADACPVKDEIYKVALRNSVPVTIVAGGLQFNAPTTGTNLLVLKAGNTQTGGINSGVDYDSISLTPEPTTLLLLALPSVALLRRRVRHA